jgi:putative thioredoxin
MVIDKVLALATDRGVGSNAGESEGKPEPEEKLEPEEVRALDALEVGDFSAAKAAYQEWLGRAPGNSLAQLGLAQVELLLRINGLDTAEVIAQADKEQTNIKLQQQAADCEMSLGKFEAAFNRLIHSIKLTSGDDRKEYREHLVGLFALVDGADPILVRARQQLASALF